ncbi:DUF4231 domain-containing protein [Paenibacillus aestuarii]|uniref:DUF4231 domain-containing protein n=1 Tax=Paenibacillus aestuarii TaxID=516965 RepID=A0ABW0KFC7_9BACL|nr:DUF4231 domain-containing protein [Paenibacillus aestuarii]
MSSNEKAKFLQQEIQDMILFFQKRKRRNKKKAFYIKLLTIICSALISVLLGLKDINAGNLLVNISIGLGAFITVLNFIESFYNHKELWIKEAKAHIELLELKTNIDFYIVGEDNSNIKLTDLEKFKDRFNEIINTNANNWASMHHKTTNKEDSHEK